MTFREPDSDGLRSAPNAANAEWQAFTYVSRGDASGDNVADRQRPPMPLDSESLNQSNLHSYPLSEAHTGDRLCIIALHCGEMDARLMAMGLMPGTIVQVISHTQKGSVILSFGQSRIGLGADITTQIQVMPANEPDSQLPISSERVRSMNPTGEVQHTSIQAATIGERFKVVGYAPTAQAYKHKLLAMGLTPGTEFTIIRHAPLGDPMQIEVRGFSLSIRKQEANALKIERLQELSGGQS